jgi:hypothetical protein
MNDGCHFAALGKAGTSAIQGLASCARIDTRTKPAIRPHRPAAMDLHGRLGDADFAGDLLAAPARRSTRRKRRTRSPGNCVPPRISLGCSKAGDASRTPSRALRRSTTVSRKGSIPPTWRRHERCSMASSHERFRRSLCAAFQSRLTRRICGNAFVRRFGPRDGRKKICRVFCAVWQREPEHRAARRIHIGP